MNIPAGTYQYSLNYWGFFIPRLKVAGVGSDLTTVSPTVMQNTNNVGNAWGLPFETNIDWLNDDLDSGIGGIGNLGYFINTANAGSTSVTLSGSASNVSHYYVGGWVMIASYDQEFTLYPIDWRYLDFAKVAAVNASTGVITLDRPLVYTHIGLPSGFTSSTFTRPYCVANAGDCPSTLTDGPLGTPGPARILPIDTPTRPAGIYWEVSGIEFLENYNHSFGAGNTADCYRTGTGVISMVSTDVHEQDATCVALNGLSTVLNASQWGVFDESDKEAGNVVWNGIISPIGSVSHAGEGAWIMNGGVLGGTGSSVLNNGVMARHMIFNNVLLAEATASCSSFKADIGLDTTSVDAVSVLSATNSVFLGNNCSANGPITASNGYNNYKITVDGTTITIATGPNGANTEIVIPNSGLTGQSGAAFVAASAFSDALSEPGFIGSSLWKNSTTAPVAGCYIAGIEGNATSIIVWTNSSSCTFTAGDTVWGTKVQDTSVVNSQGVNTSFTWSGSACSGHAGYFRYPNGNSMDLQAATCTQSNNSGN
jgi:hypothetical protein